ncbi:hypothetical protein GCM10018952_07380 [Streptosporangium vulgare]
MDIPYWIISMGGDDRGVARDVLDAAPGARRHPRQVGAGEADRGQDVHLEVAAPLVVGDLQGVLRLEDPEVVDQDVDVRQEVHGALRALLGGEIGGERDDPRAGDIGAQHVGGDLDLVGFAAVDGHCRARPREAGGDGRPDALGGSGDQRRPAGEIDMHASRPWRPAPGARPPAGAGASRPGDMSSC